MRRADFLEKLKSEMLKSGAPRRRRYRLFGYQLMERGEESNCGLRNAEGGSFAVANRYQLLVIGTRRSAGYQLSVTGLMVKKLGARSWERGASGLPGFHFIPSGLRLFHQLARLPTNNPPQRYIDHFRVGEDFGHVRFQNDYIGPLLIAPHIFTTLALREIVFVSHLFT